MIKFVLSGETGANPVRARRREALLFIVCLTECHNPGQSHWRNSEKAGGQNAKPKYPNLQSPDLRAGYPFPFIQEYFASNPYYCERRFSREK